MAGGTLDEKKNALTKLQLSRISPHYPISITPLAHVMGTFLTTLVTFLVLHPWNLPTGKRPKHPANTFLLN